MISRIRAAQLPRAVLTMLMVLNIGTVTTQAAHAQNTSVKKHPSRAKHVARGGGRFVNARSLAHNVGEKDQFKPSTPGSLCAKDEAGTILGECPLQHTDVTAKISGFVSKVTVKQIFHNPYDKKIEAVYTFPLSHSGAVDDMILKVGQRTIHATIKRKEEARQIYNDAKSSGRVASLLEQERPNIFTQNVANIEPGKTIEVTLQYVEMLPFEDGRYTFTFPTVVGPRFIPERLTSTAQENLHGETQLVSASIPYTSPPRPAIFGSTAVQQQTQAVPDGNRINPPVVPPGYRSGHDISISVDLDSGVPNRDIKSMLHQVNVQYLNEHNSHISLTDKTAIPNRDFELSWNVCDGAIRSGCMPHKEGKDGYFSVLLMPPQRVATKDVVPKEMIFVIDRSGSQSGAPLEKAKETLNYILDHMNPQDTFQVVSFSNNAETLFAKPERASISTKQKARQYIHQMQADGGTYMGPAIEKICSLPTEQGRLRIVTFMTDGYVGNDMEVLGLVRRLRGKSRWFAFGTGDSVNRFIIDGIAREGGGEAEYVLLNRPGKEVAEHFYNRISSPVLSDVKVEVEGVDAKDIFPRQISDVWARKPLYIFGRYGRAGIGKVKLSGFAGGKPYKQELNMEFPDRITNNSGVPSMWARSAVDALMAENWFKSQIGHPDLEIEKAIVNIALVHHIMTQFTSFVAVDTDAITSGGIPVKVDVPAELPQGVSFERLFGKSSDIPSPVVENFDYQVAPATLNPQVTGPLEFAQTLHSFMPKGPGTPSSITNWLVASSRDANLFSGGEVSYSFNPIQTSAPTPTNSGSIYSSQANTGAQTSAATMPSEESDSYSYAGSYVDTSTSSNTNINSANSFNSVGTSSLQGATNGTITPQGINASYISGVNTAGTVRVNNLANFEAMLNIACWALEMVILIVGCTAIVRGFKQSAKSRGSGKGSIAWGVVWLALGYLFSPVLFLMGAVSGLQWLAKGRTMGGRTAT
ncbi:MAG: hypothetical protein C0507_21340 [Cyanobacteria bacterium PR.3.49]|nr:hypothetical protein [Cyanobacteria bacterium PR.3.49]